MPEDVATAVPKALYLLDGEAFEKIYGEEETGGGGRTRRRLRPASRRLIPWPRTLVCSRRPR